MVFQAKQRGFGLSTFILVIFTASLFVGYYNIYINDSRYQKKEAEVLIHRIEAISSAAFIYFSTRCEFGDVGESELGNFYDGELLNLKPFGIKSVDVEILSSPRAFVKIDLELFDLDPVLVGSLHFPNGHVSVSGLDVTIKLPFNFSSTSQAAFLHQDRQRNKSQICS
ncbi:hypothetical protein [Pseudoalteromonas sp. SR41-6]|uniref:hypothetical protein n=1 Tax=Pseudoalteromonas sp. SR41-6 TaxID=2760948 RepID=UPI0016021DC1|nr:hypothetical protein [Pseudoalteromonas sp. SR41-6]MBB1333997.1 hypothetical protein [Pseudoalteromonas sp. SR41-6]